MKLVYILAVALQLNNFIGGNISLAFNLETRSLQCRFRQSVRYANHGRPSFRSTTITRSMTSKPEEYDDGIGDITNPNRNKDGEDLVAEFYKSLREREDIDAGVLSDSGDGSQVKQSTTDPTSLGLGKSPSPSLGRRGTSSLFDAKDYHESDESTPSPPTRKFSGSDYFGGPNVGNASNDSRRNQVRETMMRREYDLVSGATGRTAITFQAGLAVCMLVFFLYVGLTGGIVTGDAAQMDFGGDDMLQFEEIIPVPRDSDQSVWI